MELGILTFNPFQENTYILYDETGECVIIDPGCNNQEERDILSGFIEANNLKPVKLINTHCHIDHILGNKFVHNKYDLPLEINEGEVSVLKSGILAASLYGIPYEYSPEPEVFIEEHDIIRFGNTELKTLFTPGHSPASLSFLNEKDGVLIAGDVLFYESIGRTDLPGGDFHTLIQSISKELLSLDDTVRVFPGHGPSTTIGHERQHNPFLTNIK